MQLWGYSATGDFTVTVQEPVLVSFGSNETIGLARGFQIGPRNENGPHALFCSAPSEQRSNLY